MAFYFTPKGARTLLAEAPCHVQPFKVEIELNLAGTGTSTPTAPVTSGPVGTAGNIINICRFPSDAVLVNLDEWRITASSPLENDATPALAGALSLNANEDGSGADVDLIAAVLGALRGTNATDTAAKTDYIDTGVTAATSGARAVDASLKYLQIQVDTPADGVIPGNVTVAVEGFYTQGRVPSRLTNDEHGRSDPIAGGDGTTI
jgi:hypothetical protein